MQQEAGAGVRDLPNPAMGTIDEWTDELIQSNFDDRTLGRLLNRCIDEYGSVEGAATFAGIVAKAKIARLRRNRRDRLL